MPFRSEKQRRFMWAKHPTIASRWAHEPGAKNKGLPMRAKKKAAGAKSTTRRTTRRR